MPFEIILISERIKTTLFKNHLAKTLTVACGSDMLLTLTINQFPLHPSKRRVVFSATMDYAAVSFPQV